jgi:hypothetical protein
MRINKKQPAKPVFTHEGAPSSRIAPLQQLRRLTMACMLWEDTFYVDGKTIASQIEGLCPKVDKDKLLTLTVEVHEKGLLRHMPLFLLLQCIKYKSKNTLLVTMTLPQLTLKEAISRICTRPDQMTELLSMYWKDGKKPLSNQLKRGLAKAFTRFDEYQLAKYNRDTPVKLKDVLFMCHAKPQDKEQEALWKRLIDNTMKTPDTWEVRLSRGANKKESFVDLLKTNKMGKLAIIRNLRNMFESGVDKELVRTGLMAKSRPILPFQFLGAAKHCPQWEDMIDASMIQACAGKEKLNGDTLVLVDVSFSMSSPISKKSELNRQDAAAGLAILLREVCSNAFFFSFSDQIVPVANRQGMALRDAIKASQPSGGTWLGHCLEVVNKSLEDKNINPRIPERIIVITDEQTHDFPPKMEIPKCYILNIAPNPNGIKNNGQWTIITGFSENSIDYIREIESISVE